MHRGRCTLFTCTCTCCGQMNPSINVRLPHWLLHVNALARRQQKERCSESFYSNQTPWLLGREVACSPQSLRRMAESDRPLKWCVRPSFYPAASAIVSGCTSAKRRPLFTRTRSSIRHARQEEDKPLLPHRETRGDKEAEGNQGKWTDREREREREREEGTSKCASCHSSSPVFRWSDSIPGEPL